MIVTASDALAALDAYSALELAWDGPIPAQRLADARTRIAAGRAWADDHPTEMAAEREARRAALRAHEDAAAEAWARALPRRPSAELIKGIVR